VNRKLKTIVRVRLRRLALVASMILWMACSILSDRASAQPSLITIQQTLYGADGGKLSGTVNISLNASCQSPTSTFVYGGMVNPVSVSDGVFSVQLVPNSTCTPSTTSYYVQYDLYTSQGYPSARLPEWWRVTTAANPTTILAVRTSIVVPTPAVTVSLSQITGGLPWRVLYSDGSGNITQLAPNSTTTQKCLTMTGDGVNGAAPVWSTSCGSGGGGGGGSFSQSFSSAVSLSMTHNLGTLALVADCYDGSNNRFSPASFQPTGLNTATFTFSPAATGFCVVQGGGASGAITQLNGSAISVQSFVNDTNVTVTTNAGAGTHTLGWSGTLSKTRGGWGSNVSATLAGSGVLYVTAGVPGLVTGVATDCVKVNGTSGACGGGGGSFTAGLYIDPTSLASNIIQGDSNAIENKALTGNRTYDVPSLGSVTSGTNCATFTVTVTGANTGDVPNMVGLPSTYSQGVVWTLWVSATDTVTLMPCNVTSGAIDLVSQQYNVSINK